MKTDFPRRLKEWTEYIEARMFSEDKAIEEFLTSILEIITNTKLKRQKEVPFLLFDG